MYTRTYMNIPVEIILVDRVIKVRLLLDVFLSDPYYINWAAARSMQNRVFYSGKEDLLMELF